MEHEESFIDYIADGADAHEPAPGGDSTKKAHAEKIATTPPREVTPETVDYSADGAKENEPAA